MAINWTLAQAAKEIKNGNKEAIQDIGKRFPLLAVALASNDLETVLGAIPPHITARKVEAVLKDGVGDIEDEEATDTDDVEEKEEPKKEESPKKKRGRKPKKVEEVEPEEEDTDEEEKDPVALYKECKKAGLKVKPRQTVEYYEKELAKLKADDEDDLPWGDEDEEEEEKPKKKAPAKKAPKKAAKKVEPEPEEDEDDDDEDWDI